MYSIVVLMPFSENWSDKVWRSLEGIAKRDVSGKVDIVRVDMTTTSEGWLTKHIEDVNRKTGAVIADITTCNPNVLIEVGLALATQTPLFLISQEPDKVPTHLIGRIIEFYNISDNDSLQRLQVNLHLRLQETLRCIEERRADVYSQRQYMVECFSSRPEVHLEKYFSAAQNRIDILTTNLAFLHEAYGDTEETYFQQIQRGLGREKSKLKIRILSLDPESDFAAKRGRQLGFAPRVFRDNLRDALSKTRRVAQDYDRARFEVRTYDDFPNQIMYRIDDDIFHCVVAQPTQSRNHLTFRLDRRHKGVETSFTEHFQYIWSRFALSSDAY